MICPLSKNNIILKTHDIQKLKLYKATICDKDIKRLENKNQLL